MLQPGYQVITVPGAENREALHEAIKAFWQARQAVPAEQMEDRLQTVICLLKNASGDVVGVNSAVPDRFPAMNNLCLYRYRMLLDPSVTDGEAVRAMVLGAWACLQERHRDDNPALLGRSIPGGLLAEIRHPEFMALNRNLRWPEGLIYAGGHPESHRLLGYFPGTHVLEEGVEIVDDHQARASGTPKSWSGLPDGYRLEIVWQQVPDAVQEQVLALWHGVLPEAEARRRLSEVAAVVYGPAGDLAGVGTVYSCRPEGLGLPVFAYRSYIRQEARKGYLATVMMQAVEHWLEEKVAGSPEAEKGFYLEIENEAFKKAFPLAVWPESIWPRAYCYLWHSPLKAHCRVYYFQGATLD